MSASSSPSTLPTRCPPFRSRDAATQAVAMVLPLAATRSSQLITKQLATWNSETLRHNIPAQLDPYRF